MLGQSKNVHQAEIDSSCEIIDFLRFNSLYMLDIYNIQPSIDGSEFNINNQLEYRGLEGFVYALSPFNFTAIAGNLPSSCALMGNVVVWKPSNNQIYSANVLMKVFIEAGLPDGVINLIYPTGEEAAKVIFSHPFFAGIHFTGSTKVFQNIWKKIGQNISIYKTYPKIVGETGGKNFVLAHPSADINVLATALLRGAFEYQGQKCSAASRAYIPDSLCHNLHKLLQSAFGGIKMGSVEDFSNFINAVIDEKAFDKIVSYIDSAKTDSNVEVVLGGGYDKSKGYFIEPTVILTQDPKYLSMCEEIFGPVLTIFRYDDAEFDNVLELIDNTSIYALTGAIISQDKEAIQLALNTLKNAAGNFYINDKPTGAVVGQQPFGGARASGTNDKAGSMLNLLRWVSPRTIKENLSPPTHYGYPFLEEE